MKIALIGQDIPMLFPSILTDVLFSEKEPADIALHEGNQAMRGVLRRYGDAVIRRSRLQAALDVTGDRDEALRGADCVIYAGDCMPGSRFAMDRDALSSPDEEDEGLSGQARVNGGIGGLLHTLRAGEYVAALCEDMQAFCPHALVICLGQPVGRMTAILLRHGFRAYGLGDSPLRGANGLYALLRRMNLPEKETAAELTGLQGFSFLHGLRDQQGTDLLPDAEALAASGQLGRLTQRWQDWYGAVAVGDVTAHAELLPEQEDFIPDAHPEFGESVERRKERILHMNTIGDKGASSPEGAAAQGMLLMQAPAIRPAQLAISVLRGRDLLMHGVTRRNSGELPQLPASAVIESDLVLRGGQEQPHGWLLPDALADICGDLNETLQLAAAAAEGDREALRECIETDPALAGLDRLYCEDVVERMIDLHKDVIVRL